MASYYDYILAAIPAAMILGPTTLSLTGLPFTTSVVFGSIISIGLVTHALFINGPIDTPTPPEPVQNEPVDTPSTTNSTQPQMMQAD